MQYTESFIPWVGIPLRSTDREDRERSEKSISSTKVMGLGKMVLWTKCLYSHPSLFVENLPLHGMVSGGGAFGWGPECEALMNGNKALPKVMRSSLPLPLFSAAGGYTRSQLSATWRGPSPKLEGWHLISESEGPELWKITFCCL